MPNKKLMNNRVRSKADFKKVLDAICLDLGQAIDYFALFNKLMEAKRGAYTKAVSQSQTFWSLVYGGLHEATLFRLCRAYDQHDGALTLRTLLETVRSRPSFLAGTAGLVDEARLQEDLGAVSHETSRTVKHLMMWRHKLFAHRDAEKIISDRTLADDYPITYDDINALLDNGFRIVNRYSVAFFNTSSLPGIIGADDYLKVLKTLQEDVDAYEARLQEEIGRALEFERAARQTTGTIS